MTPPGGGHTLGAKRHHSHRWVRAAGSRAETGAAGARSAALEAVALTQHHEKPCDPPLQSVAAVAAWRFDCGERVEVQIDDRLQRFRGRGFAQAFGQGLEPSGASGLDVEQFAHRIAPTLRAATAINWPGARGSRRMAPASDGAPAIGPDAQRCSAVSRPRTYCRRSRKTQPTCSWRWYPLCCIDRRPGSPARSRLCLGGALCCTLRSVAFAQAQGVVDAIWADMGLRFPPKVMRLPRQARTTVATRLLIRYLSVPPDDLGKSLHDAAIEVDIDATPVFLDDPPTERAPVSVSTPSAPSHSR